MVTKIKHLLGGLQMCQNLEMLVLLGGEIPWI